MLSLLFGTKYWLWGEKRSTQEGDPVLSQDLRFGHGVRACPVLARVPVGVPVWLKSSGVRGHR